MGVVYVIAGFRFLSTPADFYQIFAFWEYKKTPQRFSLKNLRKNYFYFWELAALSFDPCRTGGGLDGR